MDAGDRGRARRAPAWRTRRLSTRMPWARRNEAKDAAASAAGVKERGPEVAGSSASSGLPDAVSRPWSTSSEVIGVTLPVVT